MVNRNLVLLLLVLSVVFVSLNFVSAGWVNFTFNGTVVDDSGNALANATINITVRSMQGSEVVGYNSTTTNLSGWFSIPVDNSSALWMYDLKIAHYNGSTSIYNSVNNFTDYMSKSLPTFPSQMMEMIAGTTFRLTPAATMNITAINVSGGRANFTYQIKDEKLGYPVAEEHTNSVYEAVVYVPRTRNYTIMVYPYQSMPVSFTWNNFSSPNAYTITPVINNGMPSNYSNSSYTLIYQFNLSMNVVRLTGYFNFTTEPNWSTTGESNFTVIPYLIEGDNIIHSQYGAMPYNLSSMNQQQTDFFNASSGFYNISLPATVETSKILLFAVARNNTLWYGGFKNLSFAYDAASYNSHNFTAYGLIGEAITNITLNRMDGNEGFINISAARKTFSIINSSNGTMANLTAHVETKVDYSEYGATAFTWMSDISQQSSIVSATFSLPLLNVTGIKEMNVYASGGPSGGNGQYAPKKVSTRTAAQIISNGNITLSTFSPGDIEGGVAASDIRMALFISNSSCDVPSPAVSCYLGGSASGNSNTTLDSFNPMVAVMGGGKISFRMGTSSGVLVHYVNVDMLASGPPDAMFDNDTGTSESSSNFANAMRFGSQGPTIYDYVLISMPYVEGSTSVTGLNENADVNISIPTFYDDDWNAVWTSSNGSAANLAGNYSHYSTYVNDWGNLTIQQNCSKTAVSSSEQLNATNPCYIDTTANRIWVRLPHFSGTGPSVSGAIVTATVTATAETTTTPSGGGGSSGITYQVAANEYQAGTTKTLNAGDALRYLIGDEDHKITVTGFTSSSVTIKVESNSTQIATLDEGETKKFELTGDDYYDTSVTYNGAVNGKASITLKAVHEQIVEETPTEPTIGEKIGEAVGKVTSNKGIAAAVIALIVIIAAFFILKSRGVMVKKKFRR
ncbi:hypothetical protein COV15_01065 [Candidatus Woesearchaeota archaeon CG10_big_fil_rev_8_21_14_0_10_34_12]|nr:MAG: hypothetical protein COV15_01065 [Candidatus Woesearchaeota archaeon CG10_big_fil_rev_8_21_14_0_10_34_12]